ncbi:MAG: ribonuclease III [Bacteroidales bacterium]|nr:ribonuclease III [Bacteroidales bacterium]
MRFRPYKPAGAEFSSDKHLKQAIKGILGYKPGNINLYHLAFLHKSATQETNNGIRINNERLEYLGDAILDAVAADYLFRIFPTKDEGFLTEMRSKIVSRVMLNKLAQKMGIDQLIQLDNPSSGSFRSSKGDAFEALIGAMYLDKGFDFTRKTILDRIIGRYFDMNDLMNQEMNFKSKIIEWSQREKKQIQFVVLQEIGSGYKKQYIVELIVDGEAIARGQDYSIKGAEQNAAEKSWQKINYESIDL